MQRTESIEAGNLIQFLNKLFAIGDVKVFESYSEVEKDLIQISNAVKLKNYVWNAVNRKDRSLKLSLYYPELKGFYQIVRIDLIRNIAMEKPSDIGLTDGGSYTSTLIHENQI